jgi:hypothetical protein
MRRAGSGIVATRRQAELSLCPHFHQMRPSGTPPGDLTAPGTPTRSNQIKPRNCSKGLPISTANRLPAARSLISSKREHPITLFHSQPALTESKHWGLCRSDDGTDPLLAGDCWRQLQTYLTALPCQPSFSLKQHSGQHRPGRPVCQQVLTMTIVIIVGERGYGGLFDRLQKYGRSG